MKLPWGDQKTRAHFVKGLDRQVINFKFLI